MDTSIIDTAMAHRYLYYVLSDPVISDYEYDQVEKHAREEAPAEHPIQQVGSSLASSYTKEQIALAHTFLEQYGH